MKRIAIAAASLLVASSAFADDGGQWRIAAGAAFSDYDGDTTKVDDSTVGLRFTAEYQFNSWYALEAGYLNTGDFEEDLTPGSSSNIAEVSFRGLTLSNVFYVPLGGDEIDVYGKLGYFDFDADLSNNQTLISSGHDDGISLGAGATILISEDFGVSAEMDWYDTEDADLWAVVLGLEYRF